MAEPLRIAVVGTGALGRHHVRLLSELPEAQLVGVFDIDSEVGRAVATEYGTRSFPSLDRLSDEVQAVVLAVPTAQHAEIGCRLLDRGLHVLVEKPIASSLEEADALLRHQGDRVLAAGHVEFSNPAVQALLALDSPARFVVVERLSPFTRRSLDIDVILDLMIHDLQILQALDKSPVVEIRAVGVNVLSSRIDIANARLEFESGCVANVTASRVSADKVRNLRAFLQDGYYSLDYQQQTLTGARLESGSGATEPQILPLQVPVYKQEPLRRELEAFIAACLGRESPYVDGRQARVALDCGLKIVEAID
jgi:predicted dehydrogenase